MELVSLFKGLADPVRMRIMHLLAQKDELCVCHLTDALFLPQSTVSRHLNTLKNCGLVVSERRGKWVYYSMITSNNAAVSIANIIKHDALTDQQLQADLQNLKESIC